MSLVPCSQPIVVLGGLFSWPAQYAEMRHVLSGLIGQAVSVVPIGFGQWMTSGSAWGWSLILRRLETAVEKAAEISSSSRVTLIGHSIGGLIGRVYLSPEPFQGRRYEGVKYVNSLVTLGTPHYNRRGLRIRRWVEEQYPGCYFSRDVNYVSIVGRGRFGDSHGSAKQRMARFMYGRFCGKGEVWGDGLVPVKSAVLEGSSLVTLDNVCHAPGYGKRWYGSKNIVEAWSGRILGDESAI